MRLKRLMWDANTEIKLAEGKCLYSDISVGTGVSLVR